MFCVTGTELALQAGVPPVTSVLMGVITSTFGGIVRDVLCAESPLILRREIYVTAALAGAAVYALAKYAGMDQLYAVLTAVPVCLVIRALAISTGLSLPVYGHRPGRDYGEDGKPL
jgi:uncharacterized membrane protein YeiH